MILSGPFIARFDWAATAVTVFLRLSFVSSQLLARFVEPAIKRVAVFSSQSREVPGLRSLDMWTGRCPVKAAVKTIEVDEENAVERMIAGLKDHLLESEDSPTTVADYLRLWKAGNDSHKTERPSFIELKWVDIEEETR
jgi:hypothetical protein